MNEFLKKIGQKNIIRPKIGFDACFVPMLLYHTDISPDLIDTCEGGFFSVYIDHNVHLVIILMIRLIYENMIFMIYGWIN